MSKKLIVIKISCVMMVAGVAAVLFFVQHGGAFLPCWISWENMTGCDASGEYLFSLAEKSVTVTQGDSVIWVSPSDVKVQKALCCDADNDGRDELVLLCWKRGRYGTAKPFWVERDEQKWSQHLFVYAYTPDGVRPRWMSSYIGQDVSDIVSNGKRAPQCRLCLTDLEGNTSSWVWDSWGFTKEEGNSQK